MKKFLLISALFLVLVSALVSATTLEGTLYDAQLSTVSGVHVSASGGPSEAKIYSENGIYRFNLEPGIYTITAEGQDLFAQEQIVLAGNNKQFLDLVLFPNYASSKNLFEESFSLAKFGSSAVPLEQILLILLALVAFVFLVLSFRRRLARRTQKGEVKSEKKIKEITVGASTETPKVTAEEVEKKEVPEPREFVLEKKPSEEELLAEVLDELVDEDLPQQVEIEKKTSVKVAKKTQVLEDKQKKEVAEDVKATVEPSVLEEELLAQEESGTGDSQEIDDDSAKYVSQVLRILKANGGAVPQSKFMKELSHLPEETVLTILTGLEFQDKIEKQKKGRGYQIVLKS